MFTTDEVRTVPIFSAISAPHLERLAKSAADIQLATGEFAVHEGDERAFYAVISGKIEVVKLFDGVARTLGWRVPGTVFGEVPLALGSPFPGGYRAAEPSRVLRLAEGPELKQPKARDLAGMLGLQTTAKLQSYDTVVVGGGPAGLAAAVYGASEGLRTLVVEREAPGGQAGTSSRIENYLGFPNGVSGDELASRALRQARRLGAEILVTRSITRIDAATHQVHLDGGDVLRARAIILACGVTWRRLAIEGFDRLAGKGISYGAARSEAANTHGLDIHIIGAGNSAGQAAMFFSSHARSVTILYRGETLEKSMSRYLVEQLVTRANTYVQ